MVAAAAKMLEPSTQAPCVPWGRVLGIVPWGVQIILKSFAGIIDTESAAGRSPG